LGEIRWEFTMTFWSVFFSVLSGILAGMGIQIGLDWIKSWCKRKKTLENLEFEINYNLKKLDVFLEELERFRNKIIEDNPQGYYGYFQLSKIINTTIVQMFLDRSIYKVLKHEAIGRLQDFYSFFTLQMEQAINGQIVRIKNNYNPQLRNEAFELIEFWRFAFSTRKNDLLEVKKQLER